MKTFAIAVAGVLGLIVLVFLEFLLKGWVLSVMWLWFMVPFGLPAIGIAWSVGVAMIVGVMAKQTDYKQDDRPTDWDKVVIAYIVPFVILGIAWIVHQFM